MIQTLPHGDSLPVLTCEHFDEGFVWIVSSWQLRVIITLLGGKKEGMRHGLGRKNKSVSDLPMTNATSVVGEGGLRKQTFQMQPSEAQFPPLLQAFTLILTSHKPPLMWYMVSKGNLSPRRGFCARKASPSPELIRLWRGFKVLLGY